MIHLVNDFLSSNEPNHYTTDYGVAYSYNENGHRCISVEHLKQNKFILFAGCSHTEGMGLHLEESYPYVTSKLLNMNYYNLGVGASGCDTMIHNLCTFLFKYEIKPALIVLQWPAHTRYIRKLTRNNNQIQPEGSWSQNEYMDFLMMGLSTGYFDLRTELYKNLVDNLKIPTLHISFPGYNTHLTDYIVFEEFDRAHDKQHLGPKSHELLSHKILKEYSLISNKYINARDNHIIRGQKPTL
jgi:hypothetical protein